MRPRTFGLICSGKRNGKHVFTNKTSSSTGIESLGI